MLIKKRLNKVFDRISQAVDIAQVYLILKYIMKPYHPIPFNLFKINNLIRDGEATKQRWNIIKEYLPNDKFTALDIGCDIGFFSFKLAEMGADLVLGVDSDRGPIFVAEKIKQISRVQNVAFCQHKISHLNVNLLGAFDVILFMSVFHHLNFEYGLDNAKVVLTELLKRTKKTLFFETGQGDQGFGNRVSAMPQLNSSDTLKFLNDLLMSCGAKESVLLGNTEMKKGARRYLFAVRPS